MIEWLSEMSDRTKEVILKTLIVLGCIFSVLVLLIPIAASIFTTQSGEFIPADSPPLPQPYYGLWIANWIAVFVSGGLLMILLPIFGLKQKPVKAEKYPLSFPDFDSLACFFRESAGKLHYKQQPAVSFATNGTLVAFLKRHGLSQTECIALIHLPELTEGFLEASNDAITESLKEYYGKPVIHNTVNMTTIVCVDRTTPALKKHVNSNIQQSMKTFRLLVGASFEDKTVYVAKQKDGYAIAKYKKLRKEFLKIMQF